MRSEEEVAGKLGELLKHGLLSKQILEFIKYKFDNMKIYDLSDITRKVFIIMLRDGMTYHTKEKYKNVIEREIYIFSNMLEVVHLWNRKLGKLDNIVCYLQHNYLDMLNLRGANLSETVFNEGQVNLLWKEYDLINSRVYISETKAVISYKEYCIRKQRT